MGVKRSFKLNFFLADFNPLLYYVCIIYGITRVIENYQGTKNTWDGVWNKIVDFSGILTTLSDHSGYHLPFLHSPQFHDYHHLTFTENFGSTGFLDKFHGTSRKFSETVHALRHRTLFTFKSAHDLYPDETKRK